MKPEPAATALTATALRYPGAEDHLRSQLLLRVLGFAAEAPTAKQTLPGWS